MINKKAFSIIELMIVVSIIAFLSAITIPKIFNYYEKAKQAEVAVNLASLHTAQQAYFAENGKYTNVLTGNGGLNWKPEGNYYYSYGFFFPGAQEGVHYFIGKSGAAKENLTNSNAGQNNFIAKAAASFSKDRVDIWQIDETRKIENITKGIN